MGANPDKRKKQKKKKAWSFCYWPSFVGLQKRSLKGFPDNSVVKESAWNVGDLGSIPGLGRSPGEGNDYTLQYSCLENSHGQRSLMGYSPWGCRELDVTEHTHKNCYYLKKWTIIFKNVCFLFAISCCPDIVNFCPLKNCGRNIYNRICTVSTMVSVQFSMNTFTVFDVVTFLKWKLWN